MSLNAPVVPAIAWLFTPTKSRKEKLYITTKICKIYFCSWLGVFKITWCDKVCINCLQKIQLVDTTDYHDIIKVIWKTSDKIEQKTKITHCRNNSKIQSQNRRKKFDTLLCLMLCLYIYVRVLIHVIVLMFTIISCYLSVTPSPLYYK